MKYDAQEEARLVAAADAKEKTRQDLARRMHDTLGRDPDAAGITDEPKVLDPDEMLRYKSLEIHEQAVARELADLKAQIDAMRTVKPVEHAAEKQAADPLLRWLKSGYDGLSADERQAQADLSAGMEMGNGRRFVDPIFRAVDVPGDNPNVLDETVMQNVIEGLNAYGGAIDCFTVAMTPDGNTIKYPTYDDVTSAGARKQAVKATGNVAAQQKVANAEATDANNTSISDFGQVELSAYVRNTNFIDISQFFQEDVKWDVGAFVRRTLSRRMGRTIENELTLGGVANAAVDSIGAPSANGPTGFVARATDVNSSNNASDKTGIHWEDFNTLIHSVDPGYLRGEMGLYGYPHRPGKVGFAMNWTMLGRVKNVSDSQNRPLIIPSIQTGTVSTLFGYPIFVNLELPHDGFGTNFYRPVYFGNWGYMTVRFSGAGFAIEEFYDSNTAPTNARRYMGRIRYDSDYIGVTSSNKGEAIKCLKRNIA